MKTSLAELCALSILISLCAVDARPVYAASAEFAMHFEGRVDNRYNGTAKFVELGELVEADVSIERGTEPYFLSANQANYNNIREISIRFGGKSIRASTDNGPGTIQSVVYNDETGDTLDIHADGNTLRTSGFKNFVPTWILVRLYDPSATAFDSSLAFPNKQVDVADFDSPHTFVLVGGNYSDGGLAIFYATLGGTHSVALAGVTTKYTGEGSMPWFTDGHAWFELWYLSGQEQQTWGTWPVGESKKGGSLQMNWELNDPAKYYAEGARYRYLSANEFLDFWTAIDEYKDMGDRAWSVAHNCTAFAEDAWYAASNEKLKSAKDLIFGPYSKSAPTPKTLYVNIYNNNGYSDFAVTNSCEDNYYCQFSCPYSGIGYCQ